MAKNFPKALEKIRDDFYDRVETLAEEVRTRLIIPACKKHKLTFWSEHGDCVFLRPMDADFSAGSEREARLEGLNFDAIFKVLNLKIAKGNYGHADYLGSYVESVKKVPR